MRQSAKRLWSLVGAVVMIFAAFFVYFDFIQPAYATINDYRAKINAQQEFISSQQAVVSQVKAALDNFDQKEQVQQQVSLAIPQNPDESSAVAQINGLAQMNQLVIQSVTAGTPSVEDKKKVDSAGSGADFSVKPLGILSFQIKVAGTYENFLAFLKNIESNIRIMDVRSVNVEEFGKPNQNLYLFTLNVATYYQNP